MCEDKKSPCDFTRPLTAKESAGSSGLQNAQYSLFGRKVMGNAAGQLELAVGLDLKTATFWESKLSDIRDQLYPGHFFCCPDFVRELRLPAYSKNGVAAVGDIILRRYETAPRNGVFIDTFIAGQVSEVAGGAVLEIADRTGRVHEFKRPYYVFAADQFDMKAALADLKSRDELHLADGSFGVPRGSYDSPGSLAHVLRPYLIQVTPTEPSGAQVSEVMGFEVDIEQLLA